MLLNKRLQPFLALVLLCISIPCCTNKQDSVVSDDANIAFLQLIQPKDVNETIKVYMLEEDDKEYHFNDSINLWVENTSKERIELPMDKPDEVFILRDGQWQRIINNVRYFSFGEGPFIRGKSILTTHGMGITIHPTLPGDISPSKDKEIIRVLVTGEIATGNGIIQTVHAFTDITIYPTD